MFLACSLIFDDLKPNVLINLVPIKQVPRGTTMRPHAAKLVNNDAILHQSCGMMQ